MSKRGYLIPSNINPPDELCFQVPVPNDPGYVRAFWGQMQELSRWGIWDREPTKSGTLAARRWHESYQRITDCEGGAVIPYNSCGDVFMPDSPFISWAPNDPVASPDYKPFGYKNPPWVRPADAIAGTQLIGIEDTDVITTMLQVAGGYDFALSVTTFLYGVLFAGLPRFTVHVSGAGTVELHLLKVPFGGRAFINADNSLTNNKFVDLSTFSFADLGSYIAQFGAVLGIFAGTLFVEEIVEIQLDEPGDHEIHVTMIPTVSVDTFIGFGGGLRSVNFCGEVIGVDSFMPEFQIQGVDLVWRPNSNTGWINLGRVVGHDGEIGQQGIPGVCEPCASQVGLAVPENPEYYKRAARVLAAGVFDDLIRVLVNGGVDYAWAYDAKSLESGLPSSLRHNLEFTDKIGVLAELDSDANDWWVAAYADAVHRETIIARAACELLEMYENETPLAFPVDLLSGDKTLVDYINDAGAIAAETEIVTSADEYLVAQAIIQQLAVYASHFPQSYIHAVYWEANLSAVTEIENYICSDLFSYWCRAFDFTLSRQDWTEFPSNSTYTSSVGFEDGLTIQGANYRREAIATLFLPGESLVTDISIDYLVTPGTSGASLHTDYYNNGVWVGGTNHDITDSGTYAFNDLEFTADQIIVSVWAGYDTGSDPGGSATITAVSINGEGVAPSGGENCVPSTWEIFGGGANGEGAFYAEILTAWDATAMNWVSTTPGTSTHEAIIALDIPTGGVLTELEFTHQTYTSIDRVASYRKEGSANVQVWHYTEDTEDTHLVYPPGFVGPCTLWILVDGEGATKSRILSVRAKGTGISPE